MINVTISEVKELLVSTMKAGLVPMLHGSPAIGKSAIVREIAEAYDLVLIDLRLSQLDPVDLNGFPYICKETGRASYRPMEVFPLEGAVLPEGKKGWLLFLDELNSADRGTQKAAYKLILDRMVGQYKLDPRCALMAAGNLATDNAIVEEMGTALQSRLIHFSVTADDHRGWVDWAAGAGIDHRITAYINFKPGMLYDFDPNHSDNTFPSPRTWEFADKLLKTVGVDSSQLLPLLTGAIGEGAAREFIGFTKVYGELPSFSQLMDNPTGMAIPKEPSTLFAVSGMISHNMTLDNISKVMLYLKRIPTEFQSICIRDAKRRNRDILKAPEILDWATENGEKMF